jgi:hypothetical protein
VEMNVMALAWVAMTEMPIVAQPMFWSPFR